MNRFTRSIAMASARHPWRTIASWVVVLGAVFALAGSGGGAFIDDFSAKGSQSERAMQLLEDKFPEATQAQALVVFAVDDGETLQSQQQAVDAVLTDVAGADHVVDVADPFASGTISDDGRIGYATLTLDETPAELGKGGFVPLTELVDASNTADLRVELGGDAVFLDAPDETSPFEGVGILIALLVLLVAFGTVVAALVPIGLALVAVGAGIGGIFAARQHHGRLAVGDPDRGNRRTGSRHRLRPVHRRPLPGEPQCRSGQQRPPWPTRCPRPERRSSSPAAPSSSRWRPSPSPGSAP